ncbi:MAG: lasso peptide biosynthesis B2 protein [bacterium]|nr:lasso peptide biosynthesis B2 protein [bacterium]
MFGTHLLGFIKYNKHKRLTLNAYLYTFYYRIRIRFGDRTKLEKIMGIKGEESSMEIADEKLYIATTIAYHVNRLTQHMPWKEKCLVRALSVQRLLKKRKIPSTLYLGVGLEDGVMVAHAWLRCGNAYITGGTGEGYATVERFRA